MEASSIDAAMIATAIIKTGMAANITWKKNAWFSSANTAPAVVAGHVTHLIQLGVRDVSNTSANHQHHHNILPG